MNKLSARNIQIFVAGALAVRGIRSLITVPYLFFMVKGAGFYPAMVSICFSLVFALALPLGIGLLLNRPGVFRWAQVFLLLELVIGVGVLLVSIIHHSSSQAHTPVYWGNSLDLPIPLILFGLLVWSRSNRFTNELVA